MQFAPGTWRLAAVPAVLAIAAVLASPLASGGLLAIAIAVLYVHRDPDRSPPDGGVLAPADGRVTVLREERDGDAAMPDDEDEDGGGIRETRVRVGVFMSATDVHVNRAPLPGRVRRVSHEPGGHWPAFSKSSERNERLRIDCGDHRVALIAGTIARRIHPYVSAGDRLERGQRIGHVSFGSRADVLLPPEVGLEDVLVSRGDRVLAGETVLADR